MQASSAISGELAQWIAAGMRLARSSRRRRSLSWLSNGSQRPLARPERFVCTAGSQRPRAIKLNTQRCKWLHQSNSSLRQVLPPPVSGNLLSQVAAKGAGNTRADTRQGHHSSCFGSNSPAIKGRPLLRVGRLNCNSRGCVPAGNNFCCCNQFDNSGSDKASGWSGGASSRSSSIGVATCQLSAQRARQGRAEFCSHAACSRVIGNSAPAHHYGWALAAN